MASIPAVREVYVTTDTGKISGLNRRLVETYVCFRIDPTHGLDFRPASLAVIPIELASYLCSRDSDRHDFSEFSIAEEVTPFVTDAGMPNYMRFPNSDSTPLPVVVTGVASDIVDTTATLNGTVNPSGSETTYQFEYGLTTSYGSTTPITSAGSGFTAVPVSAALTGLIPGTLYHFRVTATNGGGTANGADATFTTFLVPPTPTPTPTPIVVTGVASNIGDTTATLNGTVNPAGSDTTYQFEYGLTTSYGSTTSITSAGSGFTAVPVSAALTGLSAGTVYHFRLTATNAGGTANGADATFTTARRDPRGRQGPKPLDSSGRGNWRQCWDWRLHHHRHRSQIGRHSCDRTVLD